MGFSRFRRRSAEGACEGGSGSFIEEGTGIVRSRLRVGAIILMMSTCLVGRIGALEAQDELPGVTFRPDVVYGHKDGMALTYDVFTPKENAKGVGVLFMVSGGWVSTWFPAKQTAVLFQPLLEKGYTVFAVRHGSSPKYVVPEVVQDVKLALRHISEHAAESGVDPKRLGVFGYSAGGHLSLVLGTQTNGKEQEEAKGAHVAAVAAVFPPTDLAPYVDPKSPRREQFPALRFDPAQSDSVSPIKHVTEDDAPTLLIHGDKDDLVPVSHSQDMHRVLDETKVTNQLMIVPGAGHGFNPQQQAKVVQEIVDWFDQHLSAR